MPTVSVDVDVDVWDVISEANDEDLIDEMNMRGYEVQKDPFEIVELDNENLNFLLNVVEDTSIEGRRVYNKLKMLRFG